MANRTPDTRSQQDIPSLQLSGSWESIFEGRQKQSLQELLPALLLQRRWFGGKGRKIGAATIVEIVPVPHDRVTSYLAMVKIDYTEGRPETYVIALSYATGNYASHLLRNETAGVFLRLINSEGEGVLYDGVRDRGFVVALLELIDREGELPAVTGHVDAVQTSKFGELRENVPVDPRVMGAEQSNSSVVFGDRLIMKLFRRMESGINPDLEIGQFLTEHGYFNSPPVAGALELASNEAEPSTLAILQGFVPNQGDAWKYTLQSLSKTLDQAIPRVRDISMADVPELPVLQLAEQQVPRLISDLAGEYLQSVRLLGQRTAELHLTLDSDRDDPDFAPEEFTLPYQEAVYRGMRRMTTAVLALMHSQIDRLGDAERDVAAELISREPELLEMFRPILSSTLDAERIRIHGDYHLGQVLYTGEDFVIIDFEGEPLRTLSERRIKRSPLRDVAGMMRSFDYAGQTALAQHSTASSEQGAAIATFVESWTVWVSATFVKAYLDTSGDAPFLPSGRENTTALLDAFRLDKAVYELGYEINNRPAWVHIPLTGIARILRQQANSARQRRVA